MHPLRKLRHDRLLTQQELASSAGIALRTVNSTERGETVPKFRTRQKLLRVLLVPFDQHRKVFDES